MQIMFFLSVGQKLICGHSDGLRIDLLRNNDQNVQDKCIGATVFLFLTFV